MHASSALPVRAVAPNLGLEYRLPYAFDPHDRVVALAPRLFKLRILLLSEHELHRRAFTSVESSRITRAAPSRPV